MSRHVYPTSQVLHLWAHGHPEDIRNAGGTVFTREGIIFSYGTHFAMALRIDSGPDSLPVFLVNPGSYSVTTAKHQSQVHWAIPPDCPSFQFIPALWPYVEAGNALEVFPFLERKLSDHIRDSWNKRRSPRNRLRSMEQAQSVLDNADRLMRLFPFDPGSLTLTIPELPDRAELEAQELVRAANQTALNDARYARHNAEWQAQADQRAKERIERETLYAEFITQAPELLEAWRHGGDFHWILSELPDALRVRGDIVETTRGAHVPRSYVVAFIREGLPALFRTLAFGIPEDGVRFDSARIGAFQGITLTPKEFRIGCHAFPWREVRILANSLELEAPQLPEVSHA